MNRNIFTDPNAVFAIADAAKRLEPDYRLTHIGNCYYAYSKSIPSGCSAEYIAVIQAPESTFIRDTLEHTIKTIKDQPVYAEVTLTYQDNLFRTLFGKNRLSFTISAEAQDLADNILKIITDEVDSKYLTNAIDSLTVSYQYR